VSSNPNQRNWRGILIALLVIVIVLALIVTSVVLLTPPDDGPRVKGHRFKLQDILGHEFTPLRFNGSWVSGEYDQCYQQEVRELSCTLETQQSENDQYLNCISSCRSSQKDVAIKMI
jgi:hypothetical protein